MTIGKYRKESRVKRKLLLALTVIFCFILIFNAVACAPQSPSQNGEISNNSNLNSEKCNIQLILNNSDTDITVTVEYGKTLSTPEDPQKANYIFVGWYTDPLLLTKYDFSSPVYRDMTLYAKYELDALTLTNTVSQETMKGVVKIHNTSYNSILGIKYDETTSQGSGFCFHIQDGYYYVLTNNHVITLESGRKKQQIQIEDYQGNLYDATIYTNSNKGYKAASADYDLACLYFKPSSTNVQKLEMESENPEIGEDVISVGAPKGQSNSINYGKLYGYPTITLTDTDPNESNVTFPVIQHNGYSNNGSSGGPLLNTDLKVIGVNYAITKNTDKAYAVPIEKVREFLKKYVYN